MSLQAGVLGGGGSFGSLVSPVISVTVHSVVRGALGFPNMQLSSLATRDQIQVWKAVCWGGRGPSGCRSGWSRG